MLGDTILRRILVYAGIVVLSLLFLLPFLGSVHLFDSDETNYAESAREMIVTGDYLTVQIDFEPSPEKPPLFFWLQAVSMKIFGINEFAARFPNVICGILSLMMLYSFGRKIYGHRFGLLWILSYAAAILPFFFFKSGIIDPWFNLFIFIGISRFIFYFDPDRATGQVKNLIISAVFFGLAVMTKGPVAILIFLLCFLAFLALKRFRISTTVVHVLVFFLVLAAVGGSWFLFQAASGNSGIIREFINYQIKLLSTQSSVHDGFFGYHLVVLLVGVFPASVIAMKSITKKAEDTELQRLFRQWMYILLLVILIVFSMVNTKLLHYSSLGYFPLTFLAAWVWDKWLDRKIEIGGWQVLLIFLIALLLSGMAIVFPLITDHYNWLLGKNFSFIGPFATEALKRNVHWSGYEWITGLFLFLGVIFASVQILRRDWSGMVILHLVVLLFVFASISLFTERVEGYNQRVAVKFYKSLRGQDVYVNTLGFKSFTHLFYFDKQPGEEDDSIERLMTGSLDRDAYFVIKVNKKDIYLERYPELEVLMEKDGYVFTVRRAAPSGP
ncbi:MAG: glycosyltransferase family 39 protein [Bacteroidales bacterium]|nr:glycosyltransferase family 39 protein [Bacteroidales bacterium]